MSTLPSFLRTFWFSSTSLKFYRQVLHVSVSKSWWFFIRAFALFALLFSIAACIPLAMFDLDPWLYKAYSVVQESYPDDLVITLENGTYSINQELPYSVPMPQFVIDDLKKSMRSEDYTNLIVFTTDQAVGTNVYNLDALDAPIVATETRIYALSDDRKQFYVVKDMLADIKEGSSFLINEQFVRSFPITKLTESPYLSRTFYVPIIGIVVLVIAFIVFLLINTIAALVYALVALALFKLILHKRALSYSQILQCTLHLLVPIFVVRVLTMFMHIPFGFMFWLGVYLVVMAFIHKSLDRTNTVDSKVAAAHSHVKAKTIVKSLPTKDTRASSSKKASSTVVVKTAAAKKVAKVKKKSISKPTTSSAKQTKPVALVAAPAVKKASESAAKTTNVAKKAVVKKSTKPATTSKTSAQKKKATVVKASSTPKKVVKVVKAPKKSAKKVVKPTTKKAKLKK
jgi:hypothetical protein